MVRRSCKTLATRSDFAVYRLGFKRSVFEGLGFCGLGASTVQGFKVSRVEGFRRYLSVLRVFGFALKQRPCNS